MDKKKAKNSPEPAPRAKPKKDPVAAIRDSIYDLCSLCRDGVPAVEKRGTFMHDDGRGAWVECRASFAHKALAEV